MEGIRTSFCFAPLFVFRFWVPVSLDLCSFLRRLGAPLMFSELLAGFSGGSGWFACCGVFVCKTVTTCWGLLLRSFTCFLEFRAIVVFW